MKKNSTRLVSLVCMTFLILVTNCNKQSQPAETRDQLMTRLENSLAGSETFLNVLKGRATIHLLAITTAKPGSFFIAKEPLTHPFVEEVAKVNTTDVPKMKEMYLTQFFAGDKMVDLIYETYNLELSILKDFPELTLLAKSDIQLVIQGAGNRIVNSIKITGIQVDCLKQLEDCLKACAAAGGIASLVCGIFAPFPPLWAFCLGGTGAATLGCVTACALQYALCDPTAPPLTLPK